MNQENRLAFAASAIEHVGNSERKAVLQLLVAQGETVTAYQFSDRYNAAQIPGSEVRYAPFHLLRIVHRNHGRTEAFETADKRELTTWWARKTDRSEFYDALAGHMLALSADSGVPLEKVWGKNSGPRGEVQSAHARALLFGCLAELAVGESVHLGKLEEETGMTWGMVKRHVKTLSRHSLVHYVAESPADEVASYSLTAEAPHLLALHNPRQLNQTLTLFTRAKHILEIAIQRGQHIIQHADLMNALARGGVVQESTFSKVAARLVREGILIRNHRIATSTSQDTFSRIWLTAEQKIFMDRCSKLILGLESQDATTIAEGLQKGTNILKDKALVTRLVTGADGSAAG